MRCYSLGIRGGAAAVLSVSDDPVHAEGGTEEPRHGGDEAEGEDGAPDVAPVGAPSKSPDKGVPGAAAIGAQLPRSQLGLFS